MSELDFSLCGSAWNYEEVWHHLWHRIAIAIDVVQISLWVQDIYYYYYEEEGKIFYIVLLLILSNKI